MTKITYTAQWNGNRVGWALIYQDEELYLEEGTEYHLEVGTIVLETYPVGSREWRCRFLRVGEEGLEPIEGDYDLDAERDKIAARGEELLLERFEATVRGKRLKFGMRLKAEFDDAWARGEDAEVISALQDLLEFVGSK